MNKLLKVLVLWFGLVAAGCGGMGLEEGEADVEQTEDVESLSEPLLSPSTIHSWVGLGATARANYWNDKAFRVIGSTPNNVNVNDSWRGPATNWCYYPGSGFEPYANSANVYPYVRVDFDMARPITSLSVDFFSKSYNAYYFYLEYCPAGTACTDVHTGGWQPIDPTNAGTYEPGYRNWDDKTYVTLTSSTNVWANAVRIRIECSGEPYSRFPAIRSLIARGPSIMSIYAGGPIAANRTQLCPPYAPPSCRNVDLVRERDWLMQNAAWNWGCAQPQGPEQPAYTSYSPSGRTGYYRFYRNGTTSDGDNDCLVVWNPDTESAYTMLASASAATNVGSSRNVYLKYAGRSWWAGSLGFPTSNPLGTTNPTFNFQFFYGGQIIDP